MSQTDAGGNPAYYTFDAIGNVHQLVTSAGAIANAYAYAPFGAVLWRAETIPNPFQFVGKFGVMKEANGLNYMRARPYELSLGRFCSMDPLTLLGGDVNLYRYVRNSPTVQSDPSGLGHFVKWFLFNENASPWVTHSVLNPIDDLSNLELVHEQYVFDNGENIGFGNGGTHEYYHGNMSSLFSKASIPNGAIPTSGEFDDALMRIALQNLIDKGYGEADYNLYLFNCQDWAELLLQEYQRILQPGGSGTSSSPRPVDPNGKTGPAGYGTSGFMAASGTLAYRVDFENETNASAPAQQVAIADQLSGNLDWSMFRLAEVGFGDQLIVVPPNSQHFETNVPVSYLGTNFEVQIEVGLNLASGQVSAIFRSIDPATSLPPPVNIGFLPPEDGTGRGRGHVSYTINAKTNLTSGAEIRNVALISFDLLPSIATNQRDPHNPAAGTDPAKECLNTIDAGAPTSHVLPLPATTNRISFTVQWTGQEDASGSGVASYDLYVSDNSGAWTQWLTRSTNTSALFTGQPDHTYGFYSAACDYVGNLEPAHSAADTVVSVVPMVPTLGVSWTKGQIIISWPLWAQEFHLESTASLISSSNWQAVTNTPVLVGDQNTVTLDTLGPSMFYRLRRRP
jgi:RHS repeat-associated protein